MIREEELTKLIFSWAHVGVWFCDVCERVCCPLLGHMVCGLFAFAEIFELKAILLLLGMWVGRGGGGEVGGVSGRLCGLDVVKANFPDLFPPLCWRCLSLNAFGPGFFFSSSFFRWGLVF